MGIVGALAAALGALLCLDRRDRRGDIAASVLLFVSLASDSVGVPFTIAVLIVLLASSDGRRRAWLAALPLVLYAIWYLGWGSSQIVTSNIPKTPGFDEKLAAYGFAGLLGVRGYGQAAFGSQGLGQPLLVLAVAGLLVYVTRRRRLPDRTLVAILAALGFWTLVALTRAQYNDPGAERYLYASGVLILLGAVTLLRWRRLAPIILAALVAIVAFAVYSNLTPLRQYAHERTATDASVRAELGAAEIAGKVASASFRPDPARLPWLYEGTYLDAVRELGSPSLSPGAIATAPASDRATADRVLIAGERIAARHARLAGGPPDIESPSSVTVSQALAGRCSTLAPTGATTASPTIRVSPGHSLTVSIARGPKATVSVRRFGDRYQRVASVSPSSSPAQLAFPADVSQVAWRVSLGLQGPAAVCVG
jgi:uncharacterized membrane protein (UPF0136 family)